jgi:hypothetical protein
MTTPLFDDDPDASNVTFDSEYIDEPEFVTNTSFHDSIRSPMDDLVSISLDKKKPNEERFLAFQTMYTSPYVNRSETCIRVLLLVLEDDTLTQEERFMWLTRLKISSSSLDVCLYGYVYWFYTYETPLLYKLLCAQFILSHPLDSYPFMKTHMKFSQQWLYTIAKTNPDEQIRSEAADMLNRLGTPNFRKVAHDIIQHLGNHYVDKRFRTIYTNSQNVHEMVNIKELIDLLPILETLLLRAEDVKKS